MATERPANSEPLRDMGDCNFRFEISDLRRDTGYEAIRYNTKRLDEMTTGRTSPDGAGHGEHGGHGREKTEELRGPPTFPSSFPNRVLRVLRVPLPLRGLVPLPKQRVKLNMSESVAN